MRKLHLNVESLSVESFRTEDSPGAGGRGTVRGLSDYTMDLACSEVTRILCGGGGGDPTHDASCAGYTCDLRFCMPQIE